MRSAGTSSKLIFVMLISLLLVVGSLPIGGREVAAATAFSNVGLNTQTPAMYDKFEMTFDLSSTYTNPFDPDEVDVTAAFTTPSGSTEVVPGFYKSDGSSGWAVRYSPRQEGVHSVVLSVTDASGTGQSSVYTFNAGAPGNNRGFMSAQGERFVDSFGSQLTPIGANFAWNNKTDPIAVITEIPNLKPAKMNMLRVWYSCWWSSFAPEWGPIVAHEAVPTTIYEGIGKYQLDNQARMDQLLDTAAANDVYIMLTMNSFGDLYYDWSVNAYNQANGGPSTYAPNNTDFWTNSTAIAYQKKLLRYMFARFGYSRALGMLEYWNESDNQVDTTAAVRASWHAAMDSYWKSLDFYHHPTTTSFAWKDHAGSGHQSWETLTMLDATNVHQYGGSANVIDVWQQLIDNLHALAPGKPAFIGEVGRTYKDQTTDPTIGNYMHDAIWAPMFRAGAAGGSLWWTFEAGFEMPPSFKAIQTRLANFVQPAEPYLIDMPHVDYGLQSNNTKVGGFKSDSQAYLWINDTQADYTVTSPRTVSGMSLTIPMSNDLYHVTYYNTNTGTYGAAVSVQAAGGNLVLNIPAFSRDIAVKIECDACGAADTVAPTAPTSLTSSANTDTTVDLSWTASTDNVAVTGYDIYRGTTWAGSTAGATTFQVAGLAPDTTYSFLVKAKDAAGNTSAASNVLNVTTLPASSANLLQNPGFEAGNGAGKPDAWTCDYDFLCFRDTSVKRNGAASMRMSGNSGPWLAFYQDAAAAPTETYTFDGYFNAAANQGTTIEFRLRFLNAANVVLQDNLLYTHNTGTTAGFVNVGGSATAPAGTVKIRVYIYMKGLLGDLYFDDFSLADS